MRGKRKVGTPRSLTAWTYRHIGQSEQRGVFKGGSMSILSEAERIIREIEQEHEEVVVDWKDIFNPKWR